MSEKDILEKSLTDYNDVFADILNGLLFDGEPIIDVNCLEDIHPSTYYRSSVDIIHTQERDVVKRWRKGRTDLAIIGIENQSVVNSSMPIRVINYDAANYRKQLSDHDANIRLYKRNGNSEHNPSAKKLSRPELYTVPAITLVLYFGKDHWYKNHNLKDLLNIPDRLEPYVNDYKINVFEISWLNKNEISRFKSDFGIVADFFVNIRNNPGYIPNNPKEIIHTDEVLALIASISGDTRYLHINDQKEGKVKNMCEVADRLVNMGKAEGFKIGEKHGTLKILSALVSDGVISVSDAAKRANMTVKAFKSAVNINK